MIYSISITNDVRVHYERSKAYLVTNPIKVLDRRMNILLTTM